MPARNFPGLGIKGGYTDAESGWGSDMNANLLKLSVLVQAGANAFVSALPTDPAPVAGDIYVLTTDQSINAYDNGAWVAFVPLEGWEIYDRDQNKAMRFDGAAWAEVTSGSGGGDASFPPYAGNAGKALFVNSTEDGVEWDDVDSGGSGGGGTGVMHRYWRASFHRTGSLIAIAEMEFMGAVGGPDLTSAAEANARTIGGPQYNGYTLAKAFNDVHDGSEGNMAALADADSMTLGWDFGADGAQVVSMTFQTRGGYRQDPTQGWDMQWSDDNSTWTTQWTIPPQTGWSDAEIRTFNDPAPQVGGSTKIPSISGKGGKALFVKADESGLEWDDAASGGSGGGGVAVGAHRYWGIRARCYNTGSGGTQDPNVQLQAMNFSLGGVSLGAATAGFGVAYGSSFSSDALAKGTGPWAGKGPIGAVMFDYGAAKSVDGITMTATASPSNTQAPSDFTVMYSDDAVSWHDVITIETPNQFATGETRSFDIPTELPGGSSGGSGGGSGKTPPDISAFTKLINSPTLTAEDRGLTLQGDPNNNVNRLMLAPAPAGNLSVIARIQSDNFQAYNRGGVVLYDEATDKSVFLAIVSTGDVDYYNNFSTVCDYNAATSTNSSNTDLGSPSTRRAGPGPLYLRLDWDDTAKNITAYISYGGLALFRHIQTINNLADVTHMGLIMSQNNANEAPAIHVDYYNDGTNTWDNR